jgi:hypothetical protein
MKYKAGDNLLVKKGLNPEQHYGGVRFDEDMMKYCGHVITVENFCETIRAYRAAGWNWTDGMIERKVDMEKSDLRDGMVVELRSGKIDVIDHDERGYGTSEVVCCGNFNDDLTHKKDRDCDIMKIYELVWRRDEVEEMTLSQVCKELGRTIKIVKG